MHLLLALLATFGSVRGVVHYDAAPLPGTTVTLTSSSGETRERIANASGEYRFDAVSAGRWTIAFELAGFETVQHSISVGEGENRQPPQELALSAAEEAMTLGCSFRNCSDEPPANAWSSPLCDDAVRDDALFEAIGNGDPSAVAALVKRYEQEKTHYERTRIASALLGKVPDDRVYWNGLMTLATLAVRFPGQRAEFTDEYSRWCAERGYDPAEHYSAAVHALSFVAGDKRSNALLRKALATGDPMLMTTAITGLAGQHDESALPEIERAIDGLEDDRELVIDSLAFYRSDAADRLAFKYLEDELDRVRYMRRRETP